MIDEKKKIIDLGSSKGTFLWVPHSKPANLEEDKIFLIGKTEFVVKDVNFDDRKINLLYNASNTSFSNKKNLVLIGSHHTCHLKL